MFERQLIWFTKRYVNVGLEELTSFQEGAWPDGRSGILLSFDDGSRTHSEVVAPLLEKYGFVGWFFVPSGFVDVPERDQRDWARDHRISAWAPPDQHRLAMRWEEIRRLARHHVIGSHTKSHIRLREGLGVSRLRDEVASSKTRIEEMIDQEVPAFAWVGGEDWAYSQSAQDAIRDAKYRFAFRTNTLPWRRGGDPMAIERTNLEAGYSQHLMQFQISGVLDLIYRRKRQRIDRTVRTRPA